MINLTCVLCVPGFVFKTTYGGGKSVTVFINCYISSSFCLPPDRPTQSGSADHSPNRGGTKTQPPQRFHQESSEKNIVHASDRQQQVRLIYMYFRFVLVFSFVINVSFYLQLIDPIAQSSTSKPHVDDPTAEIPPVDSWEDINVTEESPPKPRSDQSFVKPVEPGVSSARVVTNTPALHESSKKLEKQSEKEKKSKDSNNVNESTKAAKIISQQPLPIKQEDEKENVNIVFIGHVG